MCTNYKPSSRDVLQERFKASAIDTVDWPDETYQDYLAPIILASNSRDRIAVPAAFSMIPKQHIPPGVKRYATMNARAETSGQLKSYSSAWKKCQYCLVPMKQFYEPNWETGVYERWAIGMADHEDFAVAGLWRDWKEADGNLSYSFTQLTINADHHPLMNRFHKQGEEKRALAVIAPDQYDDWLRCRDPELARTFLTLYPPELMSAAPAPKPRKVASKDSSQIGLTW